MVRYTIGFIEGTENRGFQSLAALREYRCAPLRILCRLQQGEDVFRAVLPVGIHDNHTVTLSAVLQMRQSHCDCALMTEITPQLKHGDVLKCLQIGRYVRLTCAPSRSVIDQQHACTNLGSLPEDDIDLAAQLGCGLPIITHWHADNETH